MPLFIIHAKLSRAISHMESWRSHLISTAFDRMIFLVDDLLNMTPEDAYTEKLVQVDVLSAHREHGLVEA